MQCHSGAAGLRNPGTQQVLTMPLWLTIIVSVLLGFTIGVGLTAATLYNFDKKYQEEKDL